MRLDTNSVLKAGGIAAVLSIILGGLSAIPVLGILFYPFACCGGFLIPFGAGLGYGYLAPGKENLMEGVVGGLLTGGTSGLIYGFLSGLGVTLTVGLMDGFVAMIASAIGATIFGAIFGAIGGLVWPQIQNYVE